MPAPVWTRGIQHAVGAFAGGDAIQRNAEMEHSARLQNAALGQVRLETALSQSKIAAQQASARAAIEADPSIGAFDKSMILSELAGEYKSLEGGREIAQRGSYRESAIEAFLGGRPDEGNAYIAGGVSTRPVPRAAVSGGVVFDPFAPGGGNIATTPMGDSQVAANNALAAQRQAQEARTAALAPLEADRTRAMTSAANARASATNKKNGIPDPVVAAEMVRDVQGFWDRLNGRSVLPDGTPQGAQEKAQAAHDAELREVSRADGDAFDVTQPTIDPVPRSTPVPPPAQHARGAIGKQPQARGTQDDANEVIAAAQRAIAAGKDPIAVQERLRATLAEMGFSLAE